ncbi:putative mitochondrial PIF1 helicase-like protein [Leptomonas pyrrhocoris]|uniref:ATP-dependent DNA helicase n=1 Tax=Leptomonas pyrrhocoris TaxID=157538 RepID=A0A0M9FR93_LEPPY|nr:putative mitochondrial PIF1 helicase-like protein [Leptomonas pyrrhocoris]KPA74246.1 putative mitochondrial PIF1 helicase-like protein [Leptomonas pyrrhocoris]|eukprot:XP_015652685.1 putative mitochondrial PIF1 helicase-like protein [Leptomonas pyrrhocoris]
MSSAPAHTPPRKTAKREVGLSNHDDVEEVHSCVTLSSTTTSPAASPPPSPGLPPTSSSSPPPERKDEEEGRPLLSAGSSGSTLQATPAHAVKPDCTRDAPTVGASPAPANPQADTDARHAADAPAHANRVLDSEPSSHAVRMKGADPSDLSSGTAAATSGPSSISTGAREGGVSAARSTPLADLSAEQRYAYHLVVHEHRSVFITGGAGTGKSHLLRTIIRGMPYSSTFVTATTGIAALNLNGTTLHSFVGCGVPDKRASRSKIASMVMSKTWCKRNWRMCRALIIDEVSMLEASFFDLVDFIARYVRNRPDEPFGGVQLILSGDFLQLPPVMKERRGGSAPFCFETQTWLRANPKVCLLSTPFRQRDVRFFELLNEMRFGDVQPDSIALLHSIDTTNRVHFARRAEDAEDGNVTLGCKRERETPTDCVAARSGPATSRADDTAHRFSSTFYDPPARPGEQPSRLELVDGMDRPINAPFDGYIILRPTRVEVDAQNERYFNQLDTEVFTYVGAHSGAGAFPAKSLSEVVRLRKGCRVMVIKNFDVQTKLVNGSTGTVTGFVSFARMFRFQTAGITADDARDICVGRGRDVERRHTMLPLVAFDAHNPPGQMRVVEIVVEPQDWVEKEGDKVKSRSVQMPLVLAYAITVHKSQGMSLTQVDIDFAKVFESGQSYVALSRCTSLERVRLHGFNVHLVSANSTALAYYKALALQQQRLEWQRRHTPQVVAARENAEALSCTPYGYVLPNDAEIMRHYGEASDPPALDLFYDFDEAEEDVKEEVDGGGDVRHKERWRNECRDEERHLNPAGMTETQRLDVLRRRITPVLHMADVVKRLVLREMLPLPRVRGTRLVMDIDAIFHLVTGPESATAFDMLFRAQGNMMRVPLCVQQLIEKAAAYRSSAESETPSATPAPSSLSGAQMRTPDTPQHEQQPAQPQRHNEENSFRPDAALLEASDVAAEALAVMARAKQEFILDTQRPEQTADLPEPKKDWLRFADVLPLLLRPRGSPTPVTSSPSEGAMGGSEHPPDADAETSEEVNFILNRDPRETAQHRAIVEYALFLQNSFGEDVAVCTDSIVLAAYALAWGLQAVSVVRRF